MVVEKKQEHNPVSYEPGQRALVSPQRTDSDPSPGVICASPEVVTGTVSGLSEETGAGRVLSAALEDHGG